MKQTENKTSGRSTGSAAAAARLTEERHRLNSHTLFGSHHEIVIVHNDEEYRLRITSTGKLILTK